MIVYIRNRCEVMAGRWIEKRTEHRRYGTNPPVDLHRKLWLNILIANYLSTFPCLHGA